MAPTHSTPTQTRLTLIVLLAILLVGLDLRLQASLESTVHTPLRADAGDYFLFAYNLRHHGVYSAQPEGVEQASPALTPSALRSPGYPLFLTPFLDAPFDSRDLVDIQVVQALLGTLLIAVVYALSRRFLPRWAALAAALLTALSPHLVNAGIYILSETLFSLLLAAGLLLYGKAADAPGRRHLWLLAGALLAAAALTRPSVQFLAPPLAILAYFSLPAARRKAAALLLVAGFAIVFSPWPIRNELSLGAAADDRLKINFLHHGLYPDFMYRGDPQSFGFPYRHDPRAQEIGASIPSVLREIERRFLTEPGRHLKWYLLGKPATLWSWDIIQGMGDAFIYPVVKTPYADNHWFRLTHALMQRLHLPLVLLGTLGTLLVWLPAVGRRLAAGPRLAARAVSLLLLYFTALHMVGAPFPRYSVPLLPFAYSMALFAVGELLRRFIRSPTGSQTTASTEPSTIP